MTQTNNDFVMVGGVIVTAGAGTPNGVLVQPKGSLYLNTTGSTTSSRLYVNTLGGTAWTAVTTAA